MRARKPPKWLLDSEVTAAVRNDATRSVILGAEASLLHVAAHTTSTPAGPALALADGILGAGEIVDHGVAADMVVLASCASADAQTHTELGPLASAFLAAGARTVIATRTSVPDSLAHAFARAFYAAGGAHTPALATAIAQRQFIDADVAPASWSTFVVLGLPTGGSQ